MWVVSGADKDLPVVRQDVEQMKNKRGFYFPLGAAVSRSDQVIGV